MKTLINQVHIVNEGEIKILDVLISGERIEKSEIIFISKIIHVI